LSQHRDIIKKRKQNFLETTKHVTPNEKISGIPTKPVVVISNATMLVIPNKPVFVMPNAITIVIRKKSNFVIPNAPAFVIPNTVRNLALKHTKASETLKQEQAFDAWPLNLHLLRKNARAWYPSLLGMGIKLNRGKVGNSNDRF
jgi:hypothetical protein